MALERFLNAVPPVLLTADGTQFGILTVTSTANFFVKSIICLQAPFFPITKVEVKRVVSPTVMWVGAPGDIGFRSDLRVYTVAAGSFAYAEEQPKAKVSMEDRLYGSYVQEPINAWKVQLIGSDGNPINNVEVFTLPYDSITAEYPDPTTEVYKSRIGGATGNIQQTATVVYTDSTKNLILSLVRT